jgi:mannose-6-phosphate isomerase-like protein (cupin superfamily)
MRPRTMLSGILFVMISSFAIAQAPDYSRLDPKPYDPEYDANIDMYMRNWRESMPQKTHGALVERDILIKGDPSKPTARGAVLKYASRFTYASLGAYESTQPVTLEGEQEIFYILSGEGTVDAGNKTADLRAGIAVQMPPNLEFTIKNNGGEILTMYLISELCPEGFRSNSEMLVADEYARAWNKGNPHWVGLSKPLFNTQSGLATLTNIITVQFDPMTMFQPHSHTEGTEEVWTAITENAYVLLGKQLRHQPPGTAYLIPPDGKTPHANFNVSDKRIKLLYFARFPGREPRK